VTEPVPEPLVVRSPMVGSVAHLAVQPGDEVAAGVTLLTLESMKMEHPVAASGSGSVVEVAVAVGDTVAVGQPLVTLRPGTAAPATPTSVGTPSVGHPDPRAVQRTDAADVGTRHGSPADAVTDARDGSLRADLREALDRQARLQDAARPDAVRARHDRGYRTARENVAHLVDPGSFVEYGGLAIAAQRGRRSLEDLIASTPADGLIAGTATINAEVVGADRARCVVLAYDYTVLAGTQGYANHRKKDRMLRLAAEHRLPVVVFAEGGGGRPGDTDVLGASWLDAQAFHLFARLSGTVPTVAIVNGYCFAGNAALAGAADVIIATEAANLGMAGPAMIEGGGLGSHPPDAIGPIEVQRANGVVDVVVADEREAVEVARHYLGFFQGRRLDPRCADQRALRDAIPEDRRRIYDVRGLIATLVDEDGLLELRRDFAPGMVTALARIDGRPVGLVANDPGHLGGAIDADGADAAARFLQLCDAHGLPVVVLCDTPGFMVGPDAEHDAGVRHFSRMFVVGANLSVPLVTVVTRKGYGLGAQAMMGGHLEVPVATLAWPTAELGPMGLEGAVRLGFRRELAAIDDPQERAEREQQMIALAYANAKGLNVASFGEIDDVIDPADTRARITAALDLTAIEHGRRADRRPHVDTW
jgi:acetyl-CoA carboxylase carboxyltransferase component